MSLMSPFTGPAVQVAPPAATQVHEALVTPVGRTSETVTLLAWLGPALLTTITQLIGSPSRIGPSEAVLLTVRSAWAVIAFTVWALLLARLPSLKPPGGLTVARLTRLPTAVPSTSAVTA